MAKQVRDRQEDHHPGEKKLRQQQDRSWGSNSGSLPHAAEAPNGTPESEGSGRRVKGTAPDDRNNHG